MIGGFSKRRHHTYPATPERQAYGTRTLFLKGTYTLYAYALSYDFTSGQLFRREKSCSCCLTNNITPPRSLIASENVHAGSV